MSILIVAVMKVYPLRMTRVDTLRMILYYLVKTKLAQKKLAR